jgi:phytoene synthase
MNSSTPATADPRPSFPPPGSSLYYALAAVPARQRPALGLWASWWHETAQIPLKVSDPGVAETKLRWWQQELKEASRGHPRHPMMVALMSQGIVTPPATLPDWPCWHGQLDGLITLVHQTRWLDEATLLRHAQATTGQACEGAARLLGARSDEAIQVADQLGLGLRLAHQLARLGQDARAGWVNVAIDVLQQYEVRAHQLSKPDAALPPAGLKDLLVHLRDRAATPLQQAMTARRKLPRAEAQALKPLLVLAHIHLRQMDEIVRQGDRVLHERIVLTPLRKWWIAQRVRWGLLR